MRMNWTWVMTMRKRMRHNGNHKIPSLMRGDFVFLTSLFECLVLKVLLHQKLGFVQMVVFLSCKEFWDLLQSCRLKKEVPSHRHRQVQNMFRGSSAAERLAVGNAASSGDIGMKQGELSGNPRASRAISSQASTFVEEGSETIPHGSTSPTCVGAGSALHPRSINSKRMKI